MGLFWTMVKFFIYISMFVLMIQFWIDNKDYVFSSERIAKITNNNRRWNPRVAFQKIHMDLEKAYPGHVMKHDDLQWVFINAGGWMGSFCLLHASLTEYVLFFGTNVKTSGHSGRYWVNITDILISGEFRQWKEGSMDVKVYGPGDTIVHLPGDATSVSWEEGTWMVEYARGFIPSALPFALGNSVFSTNDFMTIYYTLRIYAKALFMEATFYVDVLKENVKHVLKF